MISLGVITYCIGAGLLAWDGYYSLFMGTIRRVAQGALLIGVLALFTAPTPFAASVSTAPPYLLAMMMVVGVICESIIQIRRLQKERGSKKTTAVGTQINRDLGT